MTLPGLRLALLVGALVPALAPSPARAQALPAPRTLETDAAAGWVTAELLTWEEEALEGTALALADGLGAIGAQVLLLRDGSGRSAGRVALALVEGLGPEAYRVRTADGGLVVEASTVAGVAHGAATLLQLVRVGGRAATWPPLEIEDAPDLPYRCFLVDMGRNPHSPRTLRQVVDLLWFFRANRLQLHLIDDQLCSWPSEVFPKLADERAGWTLDDYRELEAYAHARGVTIVPEIEVPGHSSLLRGRYPEVFGETPTDLASRPEARAGVERLLEEVLGVFPRSPEIHIGGDEAYGVPHELQRDLINHLDDFLHARGRRTVVWEGPPPPPDEAEGENAVHARVLHVCWRALEFPAQAMLDAGHEVVNAAWDPLYVVDHYPRTMFTAVDLERCYAFDPRRIADVDPGMPTFAEPHVTETAEGILGFCLPWWEGREENLLPLCAPRLAAVAAAAWNRDGEQDLEGFLERYAALLPRLERLWGAPLPTTPFADPETQAANLAFRARVVPSHGAHAPPFGPERLTNGIPDRFDHFLGYPCTPEPLTIDLHLRAPAEVARIVVHERAIGESHEVYELLVSADGETFEAVGRSEQGTRGEARFVEHRFNPRPVSVIRLVTHGCHGLTFPSFSRLSEVEAFAE